MAMVVLTNQQKETLRVFDDFKEECKWAILNKAAYWTGLDGSSVPGNNWVNWAKNRLYASSVISNPSQVDPNLNPIIVDRFLIYIKNIACVDDQVAFDPASVVDFLVNNNHLESVADTWFSAQTSTTLF